MANNQFEIMTASVCVCLSIAVFSNAKDDLAFLARVFNSLTLRAVCYLL